MAYVFPGAGALDYFPCRYGASRLLFRGPRRNTDNAFVAVLGGTETYGRFVPDPYPDLLERDLGLGVANFGCMNAGPEVFLHDAALTGIAALSCATVVQALGAQNLSNRFYTVHPRRNDRLVGVTPALRALFPQVDFTEFSFTGHMLTTLHSLSPDRFERVADELRLAWVARMKALLQRLQAPVVLLWMAPSPPAARPAQADLAQVPLLVDQTMLSALHPLVARQVTVVFSPEACRQGVEGKSFGPLDGPAAAQVPGPLAHREVAMALLPVLEELI